VSADSAADVELVERFLKFRSDGNVDACLSLVADSGTWHSPVGLPLHGREGFREALQEAYSETRWFATETLGVRPRGPDVVAKVHNQGERKGERLDSIQLLVFRVAAGLIVDVRIHVDDPAAIAEFWSE
jgi:ketosteroid isomerase-like protein